ncbi:hypothetical protein ENSA5_61980 [Enhygromyxa salina]|uniref:Uncharacterized protein n=1 Tax=Enhygromyxa salina TaxID=215803 RepID=A0A2S9XD21_9BACT|nr:hypothetical protein [Enhygromyxa salina]PRP90764.1 hypothetical protein ENSA5_61980 [Enhygromyxa salina]
MKPLGLSETRFALARALWAVAQRERARELAAAAGEGFREALEDGAQVQAKLAEVEGGLDAQGG